MNDATTTRLLAGETMARMTGRVLGAALPCVVMAPVLALGAGPGSAGPVGTSTEVKIEIVAETGVKRITLTPNAVKRIGIVTTAVGEGRIVRKQVVGGMFLPGAAIPQPQRPQGMVGRKLGVFSFQASAPEQPSAAAAPTAASPTALSPTADGGIRIAFSAREWERWAKDRPVRVFKLAPRQGRAQALTATSLKTAPIQDFKRSMLVQYFVLKEKNHGLKPNERVRVELQLKGSDANTKYVPYSAVHYDPHGGEWVYVVSKPRTFERSKIKVAHIVNGKAVLREGPPVGTRVVKVGVAMLHGVEVYGK